MPSGDEPEEVGHAGHVVVEDFGTVCYLRHRHTGEVKRLPVAGSRVLIHENGLGVVASGPNANLDVTWANDFFDLSLWRHPHHTVKNAQNPDDEYFVMLPDGAETEYADFRIALQSNVIKIEGWLGDVYWHKVPVMGKYRCFWCLPWLASFLHGENYDAKVSNFISRLCDKLLTGVGRMGLEDSAEDSVRHFRNSFKSKTSTASKRGKAVHADALLCNEQEYSLSTPGLIYSLLAMSDHPDKYTVLMRGGEPSSKLFIHMLVTKFIGERCIEKTVGELVVKVNHCKLSMAEWRASWSAKHGTAVDPIGAKEDEVRIEWVLQHLSSQALGYNIRGRRKQQVFEALRSIVDVIAAYVECTVDDPIWKECDGLDLGALKPNRRARRIAGTYKATLSREASLAHQTPSQLAAGIQVGKGQRQGKTAKNKKKQRVSGKSIHERTAQKFTTFNQYQYFLAGRQCADATRNWACCYDGTIAGSKHASSYLYWLHQKKKGFVMAPQDFFCICDSAPTVVSRWGRRGGGGGGEGGRWGHSP